MLSRWMVGHLDKSLDGRSMEISRWSIYRKRSKQMTTDKNLVRGTDSYGLLSRFKKTSGGIIDRCINRVGIDIEFDSEHWPGLADELSALARNLGNAALMATAFSMDARSIGKAFAGVSLMERNHRTPETESLTDWVKGNPESDNQ